MIVGVRHGEPDRDQCGGCRPAARSTVSDVDSPASFVAQTNVAGSDGYGKFSIDAAGAWTYTANSAHNEFVAGTTYTDTLTVASGRRHDASVTVNILGTNDAAVIAAHTEPDRDRRAAQHRRHADASATSTAPATFVAQTERRRQRLRHVLDRRGRRLDLHGESAHDEFVAGTTYTDSFTVAAADGTHDHGDGQHPGHQRRGGARHRRPRT